MTKDILDINAFCDEHDIPSPFSRDLFWRSCDFKQLQNHSWKLNGVLSDSLDVLEFNQEGNNVVFINGIYSQSYSTIEDAIIITEDSDTAIEDSSNFLMHLNKLHNQNHYIITIKEGLQNQKINIINVFTNEETQFIPLALNLIIDPSVQCSCDMYYQHKYQQPIWFNYLVNFNLAEYAQLTYFDHNHHNEQLYLTQINHVQLAQHATLKQFVANKYFPLHYYQQQVHLNEFEANWELAGFYILNAKQRTHYRMQALHHAKSTHSKQFMRGLLSDESAALFDSSVKVDKGASGSESHQMNNNLLLSAKAKIQSFPILEIDEDDVACAHGSTIGAFDEAMLFYLQSRGLSLEASFSLMKKAFISEVIQSFDPEKRFTRLQSFHDKTF